MLDNNDQNADLSCEIENAQLFIRDAVRNFRVHYGLTSKLSDEMHSWINAMAEFDESFRGRLPDKFRTKLHNSFIRRAQPKLGNRNQDKEYSHLFFIVTVGHDVIT